MRKTQNHSETGLSLVEVLAALAMLGIIMMGMIYMADGTNTLTRGNNDRQFATQKAIAIMEELKTVATANVSASGSTLAVLDQYDDGTSTEPALTIEKVGDDFVAPDHKISGNVAEPDGGGWRYSRRISVSRLGGATTGGVRLVRVTVFKNEPSGPRALAEVSSVIRTLAANTPPTQVFDVYAVAIENVPGWWVYTANLVPFVQNAIGELQARNPGLEFRVHWITKLSYGRDPEYRPYTNNANPSTADIPYVYFYPGTLPTDATLNPPNLSEYYPSLQFGARMIRDGAAVNGYDINANPQPYALADQYNHAMRYHEERHLYNARLNAVNPSTGLPAYPDEEPTYRLLLDDMILRPERYTNAILINLHGELFPFPPVRNYSDAAKDPENFPNLRAVTHPERLTYNTGTNMKLRVYAYEPWVGATGASNDAAYVPAPITVVIPNFDLTGAISITAIEGGNTQIAASDREYRHTTPALTAPSGNRMYAVMENRVIGTTDNTVIRLYNTTYRTPQCPSDCGSDPSTGLNNAFRLYNMDYIPSPLEAITGDGDIGNAFVRDLTDDNVRPKNTARWVIDIDWDRLNDLLVAEGEPLNQVFEVRTTIGEPPPGLLPITGTLEPIRNAPVNLSRTYFWRGTNLFLWGDGTEANPPAVPMTERFQFIGDPRHSPYADNKMVDNSTLYGMANYPTGMGYNRHFDDFETSGSGNDMNAAWPGWAVKDDGNFTNDGWTPATGCCGPFGQLEIDIPRAFETLRNGLTSSRTIYTTMTGYSYYYVGIGGEIGYDDANRFPRSVPVSTRPFTGSSGTTTEQSITNDVGWGDPSSCTMSQGCGVKYVRRVGSGSDYWWSMNWLGELYPDDDYTTVNGWRTWGNLRTGTSSTNYRRVLRGLIAPNSFNTLPRGTDFLGGTASNGGPNAVRRTLSQGSTSLFWTGTSSSTFHHTSNNNNGVLIADGLDMDSPTNGYNFPLLNPIPNNRPFNINMNATADNPELFLNGVYGPVFPTRIEAQFYRQVGTGGPGSAMVSLRNGATNRVAFVVVNGLSPTGDSGSNFIARWSFLSLIHSFMDAGLYTDTVGCTGCPFRVVQLPLVTITNPNVTTELVDPPQVPIQWTATWRRFGDRPYTPNYSPTFSESATVQFQVMYSADNGDTWRWIDGSGLATPEVPDPSQLSTATSVSWSTPASTFPDGNYIIRVEAYRSGLQLHYSYHQFMAYIRRTS